MEAAAGAAGEDDMEDLVQRSSPERAPRLESAMGRSTSPHSPPPALAGLGVAGETGLMALNDQCLFLVAAFLPARSAAAFGLSCRAVRDVVHSGRDANAVWQAAARDA